MIDISEAFLNGQPMDSKVWHIWHQIAHLTQHVYDMSAATEDDLAERNMVSTKLQRCEASFQSSAHEWLCFNR